LTLATEAICDYKMTVVIISTLWRSSAWPDPSLPPYLNGIVQIETTLDGHELLAALLEIESQFGRARSLPNAPRTLDLDLIALGDQIIDSPLLVLPHPRAAERRFVMGPLAQIAPHWVHPVLGKTASDLFQTATVGMDAVPV
jgi:2-amino-4-hydroxy-6-hydroxymethyldihydropteridine diphosphokinase